MNNHNPNTSKPTSSQSTPNQNDGDFDISQSSYKTSHTAVRKARRFALQGIFEWLATDHRFSALARTEWLGNTPHAIAARTRADNAMHTVHLGYYHELMREIPNRLDELNALISPHLDRALERLDGIEYSALLIGAYELAHARHIPYKVVIDEAILLNGHFGATDGYKLINAVLDKLAKSLRHEEVASNSTAKTDNNKSKDNQALPKLG